MSCASCSRPSSARSSSRQRCRQCGRRANDAQSIGSAILAQAVAQELGIESEDELGWILDKVGGTVYDRWAAPVVEKGMDIVEGWVGVGKKPDEAKTGVGKAFKVAADKVVRQTRAQLEFAAKLPWVQTVLNAVDAAGLAVDGFYGPKTRAAIQAFRTKRGLFDQGLLGTTTEVALTQAALSRLRVARIAATGVMDQPTRTAIMRFQASRGLPPDGIMNAPTRTAMMAALQQALMSPREIA